MQRPLTTHRAKSGKAFFDGRTFYKKIFLSAIFFAASLQLTAQIYHSGSIFAHNDYHHASPFYASYSNEVGYIEADVFLDNNELLVGHTRRELQPGKSLDSLYLIPLNNELAKHPGSVYHDGTKTLTLMIDLKTEGIATMNALVEKLKNYPLLLACTTLRFTVSGNVPDPARWNEFPDFIQFDGRPGINYSADQLRRVSLISTNFKSHATWTGAGLTKVDRDRILALILETHAKGKKIRFWAAPDSEEAWNFLIGLKVDILNTDDVEGLARYLRDRPEKR